MYGIWTNSLGLISDSFHMFFDCTALIFGLVAAMIAGKAANDRYSFGYAMSPVLNAHPWLYTEGVSMAVFFVG